MGDLLRKQPRDMLLNLCQYGMGDVWKWGAEVGGHSWRTAGDLGFELDRVFEVALKMPSIAPGPSPGNGTIPITSRLGISATREGWASPDPVR